jgi:hypothetical protein
MLGGPAADQISPRDWTSLVELQLPRHESDVLEWFYPPSDDDIPSCTLSRRPGFLTALGDEEYKRAHDCILESQDLVFEDLGQLFKRCRQEGRMISSVMTHVCRWLNDKPSRVSDRDNNKPPLRSEFLPAMRNRYRNTAGIESMTLEKDIIHFVLHRHEDFNNIAINRYLQEFPDDGDNGNYNERFTTQVWKDLLVMVRGRVGPNLKNKCLIGFNSEDPTTILSKPTTAITQVMCSAITSLPEVMDNPALSTQQALDELFIRIEPAVMQWALDLCDISLRLQSSKMSNRWPPAKLEFVEAERRKFFHLLEIMGTAFLNREPGSPGLVGNPPVQVVVNKANLINTKTRLEVTPTVIPESSPVQVPLHNIQIANGERTVTIPRRVLRTRPSGGSRSLSPRICDSDYDGNLRNRSQVRGLSRLQKKPSRTSSALVLSATMPELGNVSSSNRRRLDQDLEADTNGNVSTEASDTELSADTGIAEESICSSSSSDDGQLIPRARQLGKRPGNHVLGPKAAKRGRN